MNYILLIITTILVSFQNIVSKQCTEKQPTHNVYLYSAISSLFALIFFVVNSGFKFTFNISLIPYSAGFAVAYASAIAGLVAAIRTGSLSISSLILSYSLVIPTLYGIIFLGDPIGITAYIGIAFLLISLFLINKKEKDIKFSLKWILFVIISFVGNGMCSTIQKIQQMKFESAYKNEFMIMALIIVFVTLFIIGMIQEKKTASIKKCIPYAPVQGMANGISNFLVMLLTNKLPNSIMFPTISAGGIVCTFFISIFLYKEKLTKLQLTGYAIGVLSIIMLNL